MFELTPFKKHAVAYDPFKAFDDMEQSMFGQVSAFRTDIKDTGDAFVIEAELPGFTKEDVEVTVDDRTLTVSATHKENKEQKSDTNGYIRRERRYGTYVRSFDLEGVDAEKISGKLENGILTLDLPKIKNEEVRKRKIDLT